MTNKWSSVNIWVLLEPILETVASMEVRHSHPTAKNIFLITEVFRSSHCSISSSRGAPGLHWTKLCELVVRRFPISCYVTLVAWNQPQQVYLYHRNQQALQIRALLPWELLKMLPTPFFPSSLSLSFFPHPTTTRFWKYGTKQQIFISVPLSDQILSLDSFFPLG